MADWLTQLNTLFSTPLVESSVLSCVALLMARFAPLPLQYQPWPLLNLLARRIGERVNKPGYSQAQLRLSGLLAVLVLLLPLLLLCALMHQLSDWPAAFDAMLLYLSLDAMRFNQHCRQLCQKANSGQLQLAREQLQQVMLRDCSQLSAVGIYKAAIEVIAQRQARHFAAIVVWYLLLGGEAALLVRALLELKQSWNDKLQVWRPFASSLAKLTHVLTAPALWFYGCWLALLYNPLRCWQYYKYSADLWMSRPQRCLLSAWSAALQRNLAGPVIYEAHKIRRVRLGPAEQPAVGDVGLAARISEQVQLAIVVLSLSYSALLLLWYWPTR